MSNCKLIKNATGRFVPTEINGKTAVPYMGIENIAPKVANMALQFPHVLIILPMVTNWLLHSKKRCLRRG